MVSSVSTTIDGFKVHTTTFGAMAGLSLGLRVTKVFGPIVASFFKNLPTKDMKSIVNSDIDLTEIISSLAANIDEKTAGLIFDLFNTTLVDGKNMSDQNEFDMMFAGKYLSLLKIAFYIVKVNNFFDFGGIGKIIKPSTMPPVTEGLKS